MIKHILSTQFQNLGGKHERDEGHKDKKKDNLEFTYGMLILQNFMKVWHFWQNITKYQSPLLIIFTFKQACCAG